MRDDENPKNIILQLLAMLSSTIHKLITIFYFLLAVSGGGRLVVTVVLAGV